MALAFAYLLNRARAAKNPLARWPVTILAGLLAVVCALLGGVDLRGIYLLTAGQAGPAVASPNSPAGSIARGERLAHVCAFCHSTTNDLPLDGSRMSLLSNPNGSGLGVLDAPNLTPGGPLKEWSDGAIVRAIRDGVDNNGHALIVMPSGHFHAMSDADVESLVAYLRSQPSVNRVTPPRQLNLIGTLLIGSGLFPTEVQPPTLTPVVAPPPGVSAAYGKYLVGISICQTCHGEDLTGGTTPGTPPGPNLTRIVPRWTEAQFVQTIRTGKDPAGYSLRSDMMPWRSFSAAYTDDDLGAIYAYLRSLPAS